MKESKEKFLGCSIMNVFLRGSGRLIFNTNKEQSSTKKSNASDLERKRWDGDFEPIARGGMHASLWAREPVVNSAVSSIKSRAGSRVNMREEVSKVTYSKFD
jgi:hypothetical protein